MSWYIPPGGSGGGSSASVRGMLARYSLPTDADWTSTAPDGHTVLNSSNAASMSSTGGVFTLEHSGSTSTDWTSGTQTGPGFSLDDAVGHIGDFDVMGRFFGASLAASGFDYGGLLVYNSASAGDFVTCRIGRSGGNYVVNWNRDGSGGTVAVTQANLETDGVWLRIRQQGTLVAVMYKVGGESLPDDRSGWTVLRTLRDSWAIGAAVSLKVGVVSISTTGNGWTLTANNLELNGMATDPKFTT